MVEEEDMVSGSRGRWGGGCDVDIRLVCQHQCVYIHRTVIEAKSLCIIPAEKVLVRGVLSIALLVEGDIELIRIRHP